MKGVIRDMSLCSRGKSSGSSFRGGGRDFIPFFKRGWSKRIIFRDTGDNQRRLVVYAHAGHAMDLVCLLRLVEQKERKLHRASGVARECYHGAVCTPMTWSCL